MKRTRARFAAASLVALVALTGCGADSGVRLGAAAIVSGNRIETSTLEDRVEQALANPVAKQRFGSDQAEFQRQQLSRLITAELVRIAAEEKRVTVSESDVNARLADFVEQAGSRAELEKQAAESGVPVVHLRDFLRDLVRQDKLGDKLVEGVDVPAEQLRSAYEQNIGQFDRVEAAHILVEDRATAERVLAEVKADPSRFAALAQELSIDETSAKNGGSLGTQGRGTFVPEFDDAVFGAKAGDVLLVQTQFGFHVVHVISRETKTLAEAEPELRRLALQDQRAAELQDVLNDTAREADIKVNPRFGAWDLITLDVVPFESTLSTPAAGATTAPAPGDGLTGGGQPAPEETPAQ